MKGKLFIGQKVYVEPLAGSNAARHSKEIKECIITKVGNKYFQVNNMSGRRFFVETMQHDGLAYASEYKVYMSFEEIQDKNDYKLLSEKIKTHKFTLDQLKEIVKTYQL